MTMFAGRPVLLWLAGLAIMLIANAALARMTTEVDRNAMALGETVRLIISADDGEQPDELDLSVLTRDFDILQRSSATSARIIGGEQNVTRTLELELAPKRDGLLAIPALRYGGRQTTPIAIKVDPEPKIQQGDELVTFNATVDRNAVYVQGQLILTVTLQQAINLDNRAVSELDIPNTYVEQLEQKSFQRRIGGRLWQVTELRYALFPQQSDTLEIPPITFSGRELLPGRSLLGARLGRRISLSTDAFSIDVKPVPASFPGDVWIPARSFTLSDSWTKPPAALLVGDSTTRTIELVAEGLQGSQLPPITSLGVSGSRTGLRFYPDKETVEQREIGTGLEGYRLQSEALVATEGGRWDLPELVVPWWNTETDSLEYARIPAAEIIVDAGQTITTADELGGVSPTVNNAAPVADLTSSPFWQATSLSGWILSAVLGVLLWRRRPIPQPAAAARSPGPTIGNRELVPLRLACSENNATAAREALRIWGQTFMQSPTLPSLNTLAEVVEPPLQEQILGLDTALYGDAKEAWRGDQLFAAVRQQSSLTKAKDHEAPALYPSG